jgi:phospholipid transport system substrate-binding protein
MLCTIHVTRLFPNHIQPAWDFTMSTTNLHLRAAPPMTLRRRTVARLALFCMTATSLPFRVEADPAVTAPIQRLCDALIGVMRAGAAVPFAQRYDRLAPTIDAVFDVQTILEASVGPSWDGLPVDQRSALDSAFRRYTIASYVGSFDSFSGQRFEISPDTRPLPNNEQAVSTSIIPVSGDQHRLDYIMRQVGGAWRVVDVLAEGTISRVAVQRSDFRYLLRQGGGEALLTSLQRKAAALAGG